jgi:hypothetical protein
MLPAILRHEWHLHRDRHMDELAKISSATPAEEFKEALKMWCEQTVRTIGVKCFTKGWNNTLLGSLLHENIPECASAFTSPNF